MEGRDPERARPAATATAEARSSHTTISGLEVAPVYEADDVATDYARDLGDPGSYPYTRGIHETMYRGRLWT
ncbi:MAG: methylmalonyl-CoA mutase family protein, partial [Gaiellaceae bacterium]